jgi:peroxisomal 3,2-trans-enoyl-CoA isomerase
LTLGNDISALASSMADSDLSPEEISKQSNQVFKDFIDAMIDFEKPIAALVNGPAIGIGVTHLPLCDLVLSSDSAYFLTPFTRLGLTPEGCSSYTFPKIMGTSMASEMLMLNAKFNAKEVENYHGLNISYRSVSLISPKVFC